MAFDLSTAKPVDAPVQGGGFDLSTARPVQGAQPVAAQQTTEVTPQGVRTREQIIASNPEAQRLTRGMQMLGQSGDYMGAQGYQSELDKLVELELLRDQNPQMAQVVEDTPRWQRPIISVGRGMTDIARGAGIAGPEQSTEALDALEAQTMGGGAGRVAGQMAPFAPLAAVGGMVAPGVKTGTAIASGLGAAEGYTSAVGEGVDPTMRTLVGAAAPVAAVAGAAGGKALANKFLGNTDEIRGALQASKPSASVDALDTIITQGGDGVASRIRAVTGEIDPYADKSLIAIKKAAQEPGDTVENVAAAIAKRKLDASKGVAAPYQAGGARGYKQDRIAKRAIDEGFPESATQLVKTSTPQTKNVQREILKDVRGSLKNDRYRVEKAPSKVIGRSLFKRLKAAEKINKEAGQEIRGVVNQFRENGTQVDISEPAQKFLDDIQGLGVRPKLKADGSAVLDKRGRPVLDFDNSVIQGLSEQQKPIKQVFNRMISGGRNPGAYDAYDAHNAKQWLDAIIKPKKGTAIQNNVQNVVTGLRKGINEQIRAVSPAYKNANTKFAETIDPINEIRRLAGKNTDLAGSNADESLGLLSRRVTSNAQSSGPLNDAIAKLENTANKYGANFTDSIIDQQQFLNAIEKKVGPMRDTSFAGQIDTAISGSDLAKSAARSQFDPIGATADVFGKLTKKSKKAEFDDYLDAIEGLLGSNPAGNK